MRCQDVRALLDLADVDAKLDRSDVGTHFGACARCARRWPEVAILLDLRSAPAVRLTRRSVRGVLAAALIGAALLGLAELAGTQAPEAPGGDPDGVIAEARVPERPTGGSSNVVHGTSTYERGQRFESRITHAVWSAPLPSCLQIGGSGS
jgi:hypothetical protein